VEIIYIGTPNTSHYQDAKAALDAGKHCLLEKPATLNAAEWKALVKIAQEKKLFLMEAMWTRFLPIAYTLQDKLHKEKVIGDIKSVNVDFSCAFFGCK
jgi:dihydrodiol dehydrogenase / D-xylose 1-dehydrogenase (NADP)